MRKRIPFVLCVILFEMFPAGGKSLSGDTLHIDSILKQSTKLQKSNEHVSYSLACEALKLSKEQNYKKGIRGALIRIGSIVFTRGNNDSALAIINEALSISISLNDYKGASGSSILLSYIYESKGKQDSAFKALYQAMRYSKIVNDSANLMQINNALGDLNYNYQDFKSSMKNYLLAAQLAGYLKNSDGILSAYMGIGNTNYRLGKFKDALLYYFKVDSVSRVNNDVVTTAQNLNNIALCYSDLKNYLLAKHYYKLALDEYISRNMNTEIANAYFNLGGLYIKINKPDSSIYYLNLAIPIGRKTGDLNRVARCYELLANVDSIKRNFYEAYKYQLMFTELSDSLLNAEKISSISEMQTKYETEKKEQQIMILDEQNKTKLAQRNFFIAGSIVLLLGLFVLGFYYMQRNKLAKKNEQISQQKITTLLNEQEIKSYNAMIEGQEEERKRIAADLHDRLGSMLSTVKLLFSSLDSKIDNAQEQYTSANALLDEACVEVRRISHNLSTGMVMSFGLVAALEELCESIDNSKLIKCKLLAYGMDERLDQQTEIGIYRMIQELFNNILKHAKARQVTVQVNRVDDSVNITVEDDGIGFDVKEKMKSGGMGLGNLETRALKLNGVYHIDSKPGRGTISIIEIPITKNEL